MTMYSEIKLRKPTEETCSNLERILKKYQESSASKALTRYINDIGHTHQVIADLNDERRELKKLNQQHEFEIFNLRVELNDIKSTYKRLNYLLSGDKQAS